jgi:hypothetical protein
VTGQNFSLTAHRAAAPGKYSESGVGYGISDADLPIFHRPPANLPELRGCLLSLADWLMNDSSVDGAGRIQQSLSCQYGAATACHRPRTAIVGRARAGTTR